MAQPWCYYFEVTVDYFIVGECVRLWPRADGLHVGPESLPGGAVFIQWQDPGFFERLDKFLRGQLAREGSSGVSVAGKAEEGALAGGGC